MTFDNGPNLLDPDTVEQLTAFIARVESDSDVMDVVFRSEKSGYESPTGTSRPILDRVAAIQPGPTGLHPYVEQLCAAEQAARGHSLGDPWPHPRRRGHRVRARHRHRFASERAVLGQFEVRVGAVPGGGPMARLGRLVGRGRALEILLGGDDIPAALAAEYGYVNRLIADARGAGEATCFLLTEYL